MLLSEQRGERTGEYITCAREEERVKITAANHRLIQFGLETMNFFAAIRLVSCRLANNLIQNLTHECIHE